MDMETTWVCASPVGPLTLVERDGRLSAVRFGDFGSSETPAPVLHRAAAQLGEYFAGRRRTFDLPLAAEGTPFQQAVWRALEKIPYGEIRTYGEIARAVGNPAACRAVGMANHRNPLPVVIPCHRVVGADGRLTGYGGGLEIKRLLLELERRG